MAKFNLPFVAIPLCFIFSGALCCSNDNTDDSSTGNETVCTRTVPETISPSIDCTPLEIGDDYDGCSMANTPCGSVTGCLVERNEDITEMIQTEYTGPVDGFIPPETLLPPVGTLIEGKGSGWFARGDGTLATGSCMLPPLNNIMAAALTTRQFGNADWCGSCAEVVGRSGKRVRVMIVDQCAGCEEGGLDLASGEDSPYRMLNLPGNPDTCHTGLQPITWKIVPCETQGGIVIHYSEGFNFYTPAIQIRNHRLSLAKLEEYLDDQWLEVERQSHNQYQLSPRGEPQHLTLRITAVDGSQITGTFPQFQEGLNFEATNQF